MFWIVASFVFTPNQENRNLPKKMNPGSWKPPGRYFLSQQCKFREADQWASPFVCEQLVAQLYNLAI